MERSKSSGNSIKKPTRRTFLQGTAGAVAAATVAGPVILTPGKAKASAVLRLADDGGQTHDGRLKHYIKPYMAETGVEVQTHLGARDLARIKAMVSTNNLEFDITADGAARLMAAAKGNLLEPIDYKRLKTERLLNKGWMWEHSVAFQSVTGGLGYNSKKVAPDKAPKTWADFFDTKNFPGRRGMLVRPNETLEIALMASGVDPKNLYPLDIDRAFSFLDKNKAAINIWVGETPKTIEHLMTGELDYCYTFSGRVATAKSQNFPVDFVNALPIMLPQNFAIVKGVKNYDLCISFIDWWLTNVKAHQGFFAEFLGNAPVDRPSFEALPASVKEHLPDSNNPNICWIDPVYWGDNLEKVTARFQLWQIR